MGENVDYKQFEQFAKKLEKQLSDEKREKFMEDCIKELAARFLSRVIKRTPVGEYGEKVEVTKKIYRYEAVEGKLTKSGKQKKRRIDTGQTKTVMVTKSTDKHGGTLRRGWTANSEREAELGAAFGGGNGVDSYLDSMKVKKIGGSYQITISNPVNYGVYVNYGHRTRGGGGWVDGLFFLEISEKEVQSLAPALLEKRLMELLKGAFE